MVETQLKVTVLFFSVLREKLDCTSMEVLVDPGMTGRDLLNKLSAEHEAIKAYRSVIRLAVNTAYVPEAIKLNDGDEVALITPVSGG